MIAILASYLMDESLSGCLDVKETKKEPQLFPYIFIGTLLGK